MTKIVNILLIGRCNHDIGDYLRGICADRSATEVSRNGYRTKVWFSNRPPEAYYTVILDGHKDEEDIRQRTEGMNYHGIRYTSGEYSSYVINYAMSRLRRSRV